ncbi:MAG TPA: DUF4261 domain-containing protein [Pseudobacteroides sp.]|nr:DUF4261 domain-containing protein [Pseudobacteroides sp.]
MPNKGFYTQGFAILLDNEVPLDRIVDAISDEFKVVKRIDKSSDWAISGPAITIEYQKEINGYISADVVNATWPDGMGDPQKESMIFGAWAMGHFGPFTYPGNLLRASYNCWSYPEGKKHAQEHKAFIRICSSYIFGSVSKNAPCIPEDYDVISEMMFLTKLTRKLLDIPEALCYFNPNGEVLASKEIIDSLLDRQVEIGLLPLELWANVRLFNLPDNNDWMLMDTVGMLQLDTSDHEAIFDKNSYDLNEVGNFLRNASNYVFQNGPVIKDGDTMDGPGGIRWQGATFEEGVSSPPREVIRWFPMDNKKRPEGFVKADNKDGKKGFLKRFFKK